MKNLFTLLGLMGIVMYSNAQSFTSGDFKYSRGGGGNYVVIEGFAETPTLSDSTLVIPTTVRYAWPWETDSVEYVVAYIGGRAFVECEALKSVVLGDSIKEIGPIAFYNCSHLRTVDIGNTIEKIHSGAFACSPLQSLSLSALTPPEVQGDSFGFPEWGYTRSSLFFETCNLSVPEEAIDAYIADIFWSNFFKYQRAGDFAYTIDFTSKTAELKSYISEDREEVTHLQLPSKVEALGETYPVTNIGKSAFSYMSKLHEITIPESYIGIGENAFYNCTSLQSIDFPNSITIVSDKAFAECTSLQSIDFPNSITTIGNKAFAGCKSLYEIILGTGVQTISNGAFYKCPNLKRIECLGETPAKAANAFGRNTCVSASLICPESSLTFYKDAEGWKDFWICAESEGVYFLVDNKTGEATATYQYNVGNFNYEGVYELTIPANFDFNGKEYIVKYIGEDAFSIVLESVITPDYPYYPLSNEEEVHLTKVTLPSTIIEIKDRAFYNSYLEEIKLNEGLKLIGESAFESSDIKSLVIPNSVSSIQEKAFQYCSDLKDVTFGTSLKLIGKEAFSSCGLASVTCQSLTPPTIDGEDTFGYTTYNEAILYVPEEAFYDYKAAQYWNRFSNMEVSGIEDIVWDEIEMNAPIEIFDINGRKIQGDLSSLSSGVYIVKQGQKIKKMLVR